MLNPWSAGLLVALLAAVVATQVRGRGPGAWAIFLAGALATVALRLLPLSGAEAALASAAPLVLFLFALFAFAVALERCGAIDHLARWLVGRTRTPGGLPAAIFLGAGVGSAFLVNDAIALLGVPVLFGVARRSGIRPEPLLLSLAFSVTVGSVATPFGNPQNLYIALTAGIAQPVTTFARYLLLPTAINLVAGAAYVRWRYGRRIAAESGRPGASEPPAVPLLPAGGWPARLARAPVLAIFPATLVALVVGETIGGGPRVPVVPSWEIAGAGAVLVLLLSEARREVLRGVDWETLVLFASLFVVVGGAVGGGVVSALERLLPIPGPGRPGPDLLAIAATSLVGAQLFSNVPWVALQIPVLQGVGFGPAPLPWLALAAASTLAGNVTILGAASNLIVVRQAERAGVRISLGSFVRDGLPIAAFTVAVTVACLAAGL